MLFFFNFHFFFSPILSNRGMRNFQTRYLNESEIMTNSHDNLGKK